MSKITVDLRDRATWELERARQVARERGVDLRAALKIVRLTERAINEGLWRDHIEELRRK